jgi:hypothetical protein
LLIPGEPPFDFTYPNLDRNGNVDLSPETTPAFVGPQSATFAAALDIPIPWIDRVRRGDGRIFIWGWTEYNDVFKTTIHHRTEFCNELVVLGIGADEQNPQTVKAAISFPLYGPFNSAN